ncbi:hypothetical protein BDP55DRAFT_765759 [Colletotrichum godetiae]|uniref:Uncharacterized protein n=1 Tax=Colletotrichum godetiae TaxID=1209918 RepID=A0AAJ0ASD6_9PEZI|nr:uncharacterized protein BDP55DRAFT_765759 [Colletotrichum godetiae]KAK1689505.1 hypothetical protein BDP55DRAFT_765759 [Colletotrichum godetiae]
MPSSTHSHPAIPNTASFITEARAGFIADLDSTPSTAKERQELLTSIQSFAFQFLKAAAQPPPSHRHDINTEDDISSVEQRDVIFAAEANMDRDRDTDDLAQQGLNVLWYMFTQTAQVIDVDDAFQDRLVGLLAWTREFDGVYRQLHGIVGSAGGGAGGWDSYGFGQGLRLAWEQLVADVHLPSAMQKSRNLAAFSAKVMAVGLCKESVAGTAFWVFERALGGDENGDGDGDGGEIFLRGLVAAVGVWLEYASHQLLARCCSSPSCVVGGGRRKVFVENPISLVDDLLKDQATAEPQCGEFSMSHWLRWRRRLQELSRDADADVARLAKRGFMSMIFCGRDLRVEVEGEARFVERLQGNMYRELVRSGKDVVEGEEVEIEVDWVD